MKCPQCGLDKEKIIKQLKYILREVENGEISDASNSVLYLLKELGVKVGYDDVWNEYYLIEE